MRSRKLVILILTLLPLSLSGCFIFGGKKPVKDGFWWDDQRRQRLDNYNLPAAPEPLPAEAEDENRGTARPTETETVTKPTEAEPINEQHSEAGAIPLGTND